MYLNSYMALPMRKIFDTGSVIIINKTILLFDLEYSRKQYIRKAT